MAAVGDSGTYCCIASNAANGGTFNLQCDNLYVVGELLCHAPCMPHPLTAHEHVYTAVSHRHAGEVMHYS